MWGVSGRLSRRLESEVRLEKEVVEVEVYWALDVFEVDGS